ncbi:MAG: ABC transporter permease, partial [Bacilli bacterium]
MWKFIIRRLLIMIPQLFLISILVFVLAKAMPGDALGGLINDPKISAERIAELKEKYGVDDPVHIQYMKWLRNVSQGDFGESIKQKMPVEQLIGSRLGNTLLLGTFSILLIYLIAIPLGIIGGRYTNSLADKFILGYGFVGYATPIFVFGLLMLYLFGYILAWLPTGGSVDPLLEPGTMEYYLSK